MLEIEELFYDLPLSSDKWNAYFEIYERYLRRYTERPIHLVEVGVQNGGSLILWSKYFKKSIITGIDADPNCMNLKYDNPNISIVIGNQQSEQFWDKFLTHFPPIDVFIDDGGHVMEQQIVTFEKVFPKLNMGGTYICEDTHTSYHRTHNGGYKRNSSFIEYAKDFVDVLHHDWRDQIDTNTEWERKTKLAEGLTSVHFYDSVVVFEKFGKRNMQRVFPKQFT